MLTPEDEIIRYDGKKLAVAICPVIEVEARRGRRWGWFGRKGWWMHLHLFHGWQMRKFVYTLSESGILLKPDLDAISRINENRQGPASTNLELKQFQDSSP